MSDLEGVLLNDYLLLQCVSKGGLADVYRARQQGRNYEVAVKVFRPGYAQRESFRTFFKTEAQKIGKFDHPHILPLLEYGEGQDLLYIVTPFVTTGTLADLLARVGGRLSAMQASPVLQQLCAAVQYAHSHDVIHGNIKPTNVFVAADGRMLLADFGITRGYDDSQESLTRVGWGSAEYASPEQSLGIVRPASDIYALGILLFRILTGSPPFSGQTPVEVLLKHVRQQPPSACTLVPQISDAVDAVLQIALQKRSNDRFASAEALSNAFLAAVTLAPVASPLTRPLTSPTPQLDPGLSSFTRRTPIPELHPSAVVGNPQTPFPIFLAQTPAASSLLPSMPPTVPVTPPQQLSPVQSSSSDVTEIRKKNFLQEPDEKDNLFWSADPTEWSAIAQDADAGQQGPAPLPVTSDDYLHADPVAAPASIIPETPAAESAAENEPLSFSQHLQRWLPLIIVILLLLGLLGALLSAFLFPMEKPTTTITFLQVNSFLCLIPPQKWIAQNHRTQYWCDL